MAKKSFVQSSKEASKGGFQGIKKWRGLLLDLDVVEPPVEWDTTKQQMKGTMEDTVILEMFEGEDDFELKDGKHSFLITYAEEGKNPHRSSGYIKGFVASAEALGKLPEDFIGTYTTFEKKELVLFKQKDKETGESEEVTAMCICFVEDETSNSPGVQEHIKTVVLGLKKQPALRALLKDTRAKQFPEYKDALQADKLAEMLGLEVVDGKFTDAK